MKKQDKYILTTSIPERQKSKVTSLANTVGQGCHKDLVVKKYKECLFSLYPLEKAGERLSDQRRPGAAATTSFYHYHLSHCSPRGKFAQNKCLTSSGLSVFPTKEPSDKEGLLNKGGLPMN